MKWHFFSPPRLTVVNLRVIPAFLAAVNAQASPPFPAKPNIVIILADDLV